MPIKGRRNQMLAGTSLVGETLAKVLSESYECTARTKIEDRIRIREAQREADVESGR